jgi:hypothetical protein
MVSYRLNYHEMIKIHQNSGSPDQMAILFDLTYDGRRFEIESGIFNDDNVEDQNFNADHVIVKRCPLFRQAEYVI